MNEDYLTGGQVAKMLGIGRATAYRLIKKGEIPSIRIGNNVRVRRVDLILYVRSRVAESRGDREATNDLEK